MKQLNNNQLKIIYRLNLTRTQAALALGVSKEKLQKKIDLGEIGINFEDGEERISRRELERYLNSRTVYANKVG